MIHIKKIVLKNFRPYYKIKEFDFGDKSGLSIILGGNGVGKTSLLKAFKFVLYGEFDNDKEFSIKNELNIIAWEEKDYEMYVALDFTYNEDEYILKRMLKKNGDLSYEEPRNDTDFIELLTLRRNGNFLSQNEALNTLQNIIPKKIAEYILFEGETISKYKDLLDNNKNQEIYDSIKKILGITILENAEFDLEKQLEYYNKKRNSLIKENSKNENLRNKLKSLEQEQDKYNEEREYTLKNLNYALEKFYDLERVLKNNQRTTDLISKKETNENLLEKSKEIISDYKNEVKSILKNYKSLTYNFVMSNLKETPNKITCIHEKLKQYDEDLVKISNFEQLLDKKTCTYCGNEIKEVERLAIISKIDTLKSELKPVDQEDKEYYYKHQTKVNELNELIYNIQPIPPNTVKNIETKISGENLNIFNYEQILKDINKQLDSLGGFGKIEEIAKEYNALNKSIDEYNKIIEICDEKNREIENEIKSITKKGVEELDLTEIDSKINITIKLNNIFKKSIEDFSKKMRVKVQEDATTLFREISENQEYDRLEFDDKYGLKLIDKKERVVPNISSGYMTIITISLIYGLHRNSSLTGTIILDAPFSVLTDFHRDRIVKAFQKLSPQVILLVYKDQIDIQKTRSEMQGKLINEFEIYQDKLNADYQYKTEIKKI